MKKVGAGLKIWILSFVALIAVITCIIVINENLKMSGYFLFSGSKPEPVSYEGLSIGQLNANLLMLNDEIGQLKGKKRENAIEQMVQTAQERKKIVENLIETNPSEAIAYSIDKNKMPARVKENIEEETEISGVLLTMQADDFENGKTKRYYSLKHADETYTQLYFVDNEPVEYEGITPYVAVKGIKLNNKIAVKNKENVELISYDGEIEFGKSINGGTSSSVVGFTLVNADTDKDIMPLTEGIIIDLDNIPTNNLNIRANTNPVSVSSVKFNFDSNTVYSTDNKAPYSLAGDMRGNYNSWTPSIGNHTISATPYISRTAGTRFSISIVVKQIPPSPPITPTGLNGIALSHNQILLNWNDVFNETNYTIERSLSLDSGFIVINFTNSNVISIIDSGLNANTSYFYKIKAGNRGGESPYSSVIKVITPELLPPAAPSSLSASATSAYQVDLAWTDNSNGQAGFKVERKTPVSVFQQIASVPAGVKSYSDGSVSGNTTYYYRVKAYNDGGDSAYSNEAFTTTPAIAGKYPITSIPQLSSKPDAYAKLYLDFNGDIARNWGSYNVPETPAYDQDGDILTFSDSELVNIRQIWARVSEKYSPFNIDVTTIDPGSLTDKKALAVVIGGSGAWTGGNYGGVAYIGSFYTSSPNIVYAFENNLGNGNAKYTSEASSHEVGHAFGLGHVRQYNASGAMINEYYQGDSNRAPIMGNSYYAARGLWWLALYNSQTLQDDMLILSNSNNAFGYRADDYSDSIGSASPLSVTGTSASAAGIVYKTTDADMFKFNTNNGINRFNVIVASSGPTLDLKTNIINSQGAIVASADSDALGENIIANLSAGTYYLSVTSKGNYGDVGQYTINGNIA